MSERQDYPAGAPCWVDTLQGDAEAARRFYGKLFGWRFVGPGPVAGDPSGAYYVARVRDRDVAGILPRPPDAPPISAWNTYIAVDSVDDLAKRVTGAGGSVLVPPFDASPAGRSTVLADPSGAVFGGWEPASRKGAQLVNEPSAWAMSSLLTRDPDGANRFYRDVFGWQSESFGRGDMAVGLWRLPGYVGGEPKQPVPRDVVAVLIPMDEKFPPDMQAYWHVDFWVDDADGTAANAAALGGKVIVQPHDTPGFRSATIADPEGAVFSISKLKAA
ncbi:MAG TPA: VOC family protein [Candidatus Binatus sp.]|nr:VOC family protein [Candidatus Binatus sp.]